jgi:hypothetical protein
MAAGGKGKAGGSLFSGAPWGPSAALLFLVLCFCGLTKWGRTYPTFAHKTWVTWSAGHRLTAEERRLQGYDDTYPVLLYVRENTPPDAVILLPPGRLLGATESESPLLASPSSAYTFLYPRVPVHWGDPSPYRDRIDHILVWNHWGLDLVDPGAAKTEENRIMVCPWPEGRKVSW